MDSDLYNQVQEATPSLIEFVNLPNELRQMAKNQAEPRYKKRLTEIARFLETSAVEDVIRAGRSPRYYAVRILQILMKQQLTDEELAAKIGRSASYCRQMVGAMKRGGLDVNEAPAKGYTVRPQGGRPPLKRSL